MLRTITLGAAVGLVVLSAAVAGMWTNRWGLSMTTDQAAARLKQVPSQLDGWEAHELTINERELQLGEIVGHLSRRYVHRRTGAVLTALVVCGRPGPISVHTPDVCYTNSGWEQLGTQKFKLGDGPFEFNVLDMRKQSVAAPSQLRLYLAMGSKGAWHVPKRPRLAFAGESVLFKIYVVHEAPRLTEAIDKGPAVELLTALMPQLQEKLFSGN